LSKNGIKKGGIANRTDDQLVHPLRRSGAHEDNIDPQEDEKKDRRDEEKGLDLQRVFPFREKFLRNIIEEKLPLHNSRFFNTT
jgi:hypothetical protein